MFEISDKMNERLKAMPLLEYLKEMHERIEGIRHQKKSNSAYNEARTYSSHVMSRLVKEFKLSWDAIDSNETTHNLRLSQDVLDKYSVKSSDKSKEYFIKEFVEEFTYDLHSYIMALERRKESTDPPLEDKPI